MDVDEETAPSSTTPDDNIRYRYLTFDTALAPVTVPIILQGRIEKQLLPPDLSSLTDPFGWSQARKSTLLTLSCVATTFTAYAGGCYATPIPQMASYWHLSETSLDSSLLIFTVGFALAPMILAPLSEINGRRPIFLTTGVLFVVFSICCGVTKSFAGMMVSRFLAGCAGSTFSAIIGGVVADMYRREDRNTPMTFFTTFVVIGCGLGPLVSGYISQNASWRWVFYASALEIAVVVLAMLFFFKETRGNIALRKKADLLNSWYQACEDAGHPVLDVDVNVPSEKNQSARQTRPARVRWRVRADVERQSIRQMIQTSLYLPFYLLFTEPVVFFFSLWMAFAWAILWIMYGALPEMYQSVYGFDQQQQGATFASVIVGAIVSAVFSIVYENYHTRTGIANSTPEQRLYFPAMGSILLPIGLFWFGWTSREDIHWIVPTLAVCCLTMGIFSIILAVVNYLADTYHQYSSSAMAAMSFCRNIAGGAFTMFTRQIFQGLGWGGGSSMLGGVAILLSLVPWVLIAYGPRIRARSKFASELVD
ncbi:Major facilitator superfamily domain, general substrate transporter [Penicillium occitanis (nom. inval.)]|nr:Major facilitator superfamily domain, general substrate transporter [Penicillium occitanis (nom. inval.)]PCH03654.1 hypothetical protein PENOC_037420 [Penicillium occitanis (nom. inval.)]